MREIMFSAMAISLLFAVIPGCTRSRCDCDDCCCEKEYRELWDRHDSRHWHRDVIMPREFFDARDFHPDSLYGDPRGWRDHECGRFHDDALRYHKWHHRWKPYHRYHGCDHRRYKRDDGFTEGYFLPPAPDMEYDE